MIQKYVSKEVAEGSCIGLFESLFQYVTVSWLEEGSSWKPPTVVTAENHWKHHEFVHLEGNSGAEQSLAVPQNHSNAAWNGLWRSLTQPSTWTNAIANIRWHQPEDWQEKANHEKRKDGGGKPWEVKSQKEREFGVKERTWATWSSWNVPAHWREGGLGDL